MMKTEQYFREKLEKIKGTGDNFGGWITTRDRAFLVEFLQMITIENPVLLEIGTFFGGTSTIFLTVLDDCKLIAIDNWSEGPFEPFSSLREGFLFYMDCFIKQGRVEIIDGDSREIGKRWDREVDMLYIDGNHSYQAACSDIDNFTPWVKEGGYVFVDDYDLESVRRAVDERLTDNNKFTLVRKPVIGNPPPNDEKLIVFKK